MVKFGKKYSVIIKDNNAGTAIKGHGNTINEARRAANALWDEKFMQRRR